MVVNLTGTSNAEVGCLAITDHSGCVEFHSGALPCSREAAPFGPWAARGIYSEDSSNVFLHDLNVHGLAATGIQAGRLRDWTVQDVKVIGNGSVGWDGDIAGDDSNSGNLVFRRLRVEWNGCGETYPGGQPTGCWAQSAGGYGDGFGTGATTGNWVFEDSTFLHNTSDGLDLLYAREGSSITLRRVHSEGNAGDQIKTNGPVTIENTIAVSNCGSFQGQPFTHNVDPCRAGASALFLVLRAGARAQVTNSTISGEGDGLVTGECDSLYSSCNGQERVVLRNNIFIGNTEFLAPDDRSSLIYQETFPQGDQLWDVDYSVIRHVKDAACPGVHHICGEEVVGLVNEGIDSFDAHLLATSPARDAGTPVGAPSVDFGGRPRDARPDIGAYEFVSGGGGALCTLTCSASAPATGRAGEALAFTATATPSDCGAGTPAATWTFGDGATAAGLSAAHAYGAPGTYPWTLTASFAGVTCTRNGTLTITAAPAPGAFVYTVPAVTHSPGSAGAVFR
ncbi:MAG TPA: PKD domain-containing protein, partial [Coriobacteriia bacterium]